MTTLGDFLKQRLVQDATATTAWIDRERSNSPAHLLGRHSLNPVYFQSADVKVPAKNPPCANPRSLQVDPIRYRIADANLLRHLRSRPSGHRLIGIDHQLADRKIALALNLLEKIPPFDDPGNTGATLHLETHFNQTIDLLGKELTRL